MKKTNYTVIELSSEDIVNLVTDKYGGGENMLTKVEFDLKDISDPDDRFSVYKFNGATITISKEAE